MHAPSRHGSGVVRATYTSTDAATGGPGRGPLAFARACMTIKGWCRPYRLKDQSPTRPIVSPTPPKPIHAKGGRIARTKSVI